MGYHVAPPVESPLRQDSPSERDEERVTHRNLATDGVRLGVKGETFYLKVDKLTSN